MPTISKFYTERENLYLYFTFLACKKVYYTDQNIMQRN